MATLHRGGRVSGLLGIGFTGALTLLAGCSSGGSGGGTKSAASTATPATTAATPHVSLTAPRALHTATLLPNGAVFVAGGVDASGMETNTTFLITATAVTSGPALASARVGHTATLLANGRVLITGGELATAAGVAPSMLGSTELYDPVAGAITPGPALLTPRMEAVAVAYGTAAAQHVLIAGGSNGTAALATAEDYDATANTITAVAAPMAQARASASGGMMDNGTIVIVGGDSAAGPAGAEVFNPATMAFTPSTMAVPAAGGAFAAIGADAIYAGGQTTAGDEAASEVYNEAAQVFATGPSLLSARRDATASVVNGNEIVFVGGRNGSTPVGAVEVLKGNPQSGAVTAAMPLATARYGHSATALASGHVLVVGGLGPTGAILASIEEVDPANTTVTRVGTAPTVTTPTTTTTTPTIPTPTPSVSPTPAPTTTTTSSSSGGFLSTIVSLLGNLLGGSSSGSSSGIGGAITGILGSLLGGSSTGTTTAGSTTSSSSGLSSSIGSVVNALIGGGTNTTGSGGVGGAIGSLLGGLLGGSSSGGGLGGLLGSLFGGSSSSSQGSTTTTTTPTPATGGLAIVSMNTNTGPVGTAVQVIVSGAGPAVGLAMDDGNGHYTNVTGAQAFQNGNNVEIDFNIPALTSGNYYIDVYSFSSSASTATPTGQVQTAFKVQ